MEFHPSWTGVLHLEAKAPTSVTLFFIQVNYAAAHRKEAMGQFTLKVYSAGGAGWTTAWNYRMGSGDLAGGFGALHGAPRLGVVSARGGVRAFPGLPALTEGYAFRPIASRHSAGTHLSAMTQKSLHGGTPV